MQLLGIIPNCVYLIVLLIVVVLGFILTPLGSDEESRNVLLLKLIITFEL